MIFAPIGDDGTVDTTGTSYFHSMSEAESNSNTLDKDAFLQLLVAEMQNQDPLEPSSNTDYIAQLATFSQVEEMQNMSAATSKNQANGLIGRLVIMTTQTSTGTTAYATGYVSGATVNGGKAYLEVDGSFYDIDDLYSVIDETKYKLDETGQIVAIEEEEDTTDTTTGSTSDKTDTSDETGTSDETDTSDSTTA